MNTKKPDKNSIGVLSWIINVILLSSFWPAGVVLLLMRLSGNDVLSRLLTRLLTKTDSRPADTFRQGEAQGRDGAYRQAPGAEQVNSSSRSRAARQGYPPEQAQQSGTQQAGTPQYRYQHPYHYPNPSQSAQQQPQYRQPGTGQGPVRPAQPQARETGQGEQRGKKDTVARIGKGRTVLIVFGWLLLAAGVLAGIQTLGVGAPLWRTLWFAAVALGGGGMLFTSWKKGKKEQDYQNCVKVVGDKASIDLQSLASALGRRPRDLEKDLDDMVDRGYFGDVAYFDKSRDVLIIDPAKAEAQLKKAAAESADGKDKFQLLLMELDRSVQRIRDPEMLQKAMKIRGLTASIFAAVREEPAKEPKIATFLNYYFPQTLKLLNSYGSIESKEYQGENLSKTRERIEGAADLLIDAYQRQLDALYLSTSLDLDSDIDVLETMLKRDGLSSGDFDGLEGEGQGQQLGGF